jgi:cytochrome c oxidase subunit IV
MKKYKSINAEENIKQTITIKVYKLQIIVFLILGVLQFLGGFKYSFYIFDVKNINNVWFILSWMVLIGNIILSVFYFMRNIRK